MALAGLGIVLAVQSQANRDLRKANTRERARFELAMEAIKTFHTGVSEDLLLKQKEFTELRTKLCARPRPFTAGWSGCWKTSRTAHRAPHSARLFMSSGT